MRAIMADNDVHGQMNVMVSLLDSEAWREIWLGLNLSVRTFADLCLSHDVSDAVLWQACQKEQIVLITANRNKDGVDSLEATILACNTLTSLPVLTLADPNQISLSRPYANRVVESMLQYLLYIDNYRGVGRLWLP
ncbi:MAG: hypothetical protein HYX68_22280 [Planctomycetes bacterium]|nr:hypothetical protein [Planctomycetota bacterium]